MLKMGFLFCLIFAVGIIGCSKKPDTAPMSSGPTIRVSWEHLGNLVGNETNRFRSKFVFTNTGDEPLAGTGWKMYFNLAREVIAGSTPDSVRITNINGDFYSLSPTSSFASLSPGSSMDIEFSAAGWLINESEAPSGLYFVFQDPEGYELLPVPVGQYEVRPLTRPDQLNRTADDRVPVPTPESRFEANSKLSLLPEYDVPPILPRPVRFSRKSGEFHLNASVPIQHPPELKSEAEYLAAAFQVLLGTQLVRVQEPEEKAIRLSLEDLRIQGAQRTAGDQAYRLTIDPRTGITIIGTDPAGVFYGIQSLRCMVSPRQYAAEQPRITLPAVSISDYPRFRYRGLHLDVARNFHNRKTVEKLLELMAFYKLNRFHFHLTDDEGWRLDIPGLPELTGIGGRRGHTLDEKDRLVPSYGSGPEPAVPPGSGYYTRKDFIEILRFAHARHIEVIPEFDFPGHARAAIIAMKNRFERLAAQGKTEEAQEFLLSDPDDESVYRSIQGWRDNVVNVCRESTYAFLSKIVDELAAMYQEAGVPLTTVHTGGDEVPAGVWKRSPVCRTALEGGQLQGAKESKDLPAYFIKRFNRILRERNLITAGWEEVALTGAEEHGVDRSPNTDLLDGNLLVYIWNSVWGWGGEENAYKLANAGFPVILCNAPNLYFDLAYEKGSDEPGYYWAGFVDTRKPFEFAPENFYLNITHDLMGRPVDPDKINKAIRLTPSGRENLVGIQAELWSENAKSSELLEYMAFPKLLAFAERSWSPRPDWAREEDPDKRNSEMEADWNRLANAIGQREMHRLCYLEGGVAYRIPPPGAVIRDGKLKAISAFPGLVIRYTTDGSEPVADSEIYPGPIRVSGTVKLRAFNPVGRGGKTSTISQ